MSDFPKFQISKFLDEKRDYQVVVRSDDFDDLMEAMEAIRPWIEKRGETKKPEVTINDVFQDHLPNEINCPTHGENMKLREGKYGPYYSHKHGDSWCNLDAKKYLKGQS